MGRPFERAQAVAAAVAFALSLTDTAARQAALADTPAYKSRGKGGKRPHRHVGTAAAKRAAVKARNVKRNRRAHRG